MNKPESVLGNETYKILFSFQTQTGHLILIRKRNLTLINNKKKKKSSSTGICCLADHREKMKESEKNINKCLDIARDFKKLWNVRVTVKPIVVGTLGMVVSGLEK